MPVQRLSPRQNTNKAAYINALSHASWDHYSMLAIISVNTLGFLIIPIYGDEGIRTPGLVDASHALSQLSYIPLAINCLGFLVRLVRPRP
jgi:hypothetical protein